jgi:hypothetical protein
MSTVKIIHIVKNNTEQKLRAFLAGLTLSESSAWSGLLIRVPVCAFLLRVRDSSRVTCRIGRDTMLHPR